MLHAVMAYQIEERKAQPAVTDPVYMLEKLSIEQRNTVMDCMAWLDDVIEHHCMDIATQSCNYDIEPEKTLEWMDGDEIVCAGTADAIITPREKEGEAVIVDWKFGRAPIDSANATLQLLGYAILLFENKMGGRQRLENITAYIYQPRTGAEYRAEFSRDRLDSYKKEIKDTIAACRVPDPVISASASACAYCSGIGVCPAIKDMSKDIVAQVEGQGLVSDPDEAIGAWLAEKDPTELGAIYTQSKLVTQYAKAVKDYCKQALVEGEGEGVDGWSLQQRKGRKYLIDNEKAAQVLRGTLSEADILQHGSIKLSVLEGRLQNPVISRKDLLKYADINVSALEKVYTELESAKNGTSKAQNRRTFQQLLASVIETGDTVNAIVKEAKKND